MQATEAKMRNRRIRAWTWYDWANSVYSLTITSAVFPIYYANVTSSDSSDLVAFWGFTVKNTVLYSWVLSLSFLIGAALTPVLSGIADYSGRKRFFMQMFCYMGGISCIALAGFTGENLTLGLSAFVLASIGFTGSLVFYNAFLPEICRPDEYDMVSARGFAMGYIGSVILLILNLAMIQQPEWFGLSSGTWPARISFALVGVWWMAFAQITFRNLPAEQGSGKFAPDVLVKGYEELILTLKSLKKLPGMRAFLIAFFFYSMGMQTVMYMATLFGTKELKLETSDLIFTILLIQLVGIGGAFLFAKLAKQYGNALAILMALAIWTGICFAAWFVYTREEFFMLAVAVGVVMGGTQSLSRSTFALQMPAESKDHASYFSLLDVSEKMSIVLGTAAYGLIEAMTGSMRNSVLMLMIFFLLGAGGMLRLLKKR
jgi:MFS transporter, UMF1 family